MSRAPLQSSYCARNDNALAVCCDYLAATEINYEREGGKGGEDYQTSERCETKIMTPLIDDGEYR